MSRLSNCLILVAIFLSYLMARDEIICSVLFCIPAFVLKHIYVLETQLLGIYFMWYHYGSSTLQSLSVMLTSNNFFGKYY
jgi:hypothetical protein